MTSITIIGAGFVGSTLGRFFESTGITPRFYDPPKGLDDVSVLEDAEVIFVAVPTPFYVDGNGFDDSFLKNALSVIPAQDKIVVLKSTFPPGTTDRLQTAFPWMRLLYNPEFLTESRADQDMQRPNRQIVGYTDNSRADAEAVMTMLPRAPFQKIVPAAVAETVKCAGNSFYALKVTFANQLFDLCQKTGVDYEDVRACIEPEPWMGGAMHWGVAHGGYRGYGGKCLPKDIRMTIQAGDVKGVDLSVLKAAEAYNNDLLKKQGKDIRWEEGSPRNKDTE